MTKSAKDDFINESEYIGSYTDSIVGKEDGVFRLHLPNGTYEVLCYFSASKTEPLEINLIANGERKFERLRIQPRNDTISKSYHLYISDEQLTQVIYSYGKGQYQRWDGIVLLF